MKATSYPISGGDFGQGGSASRRLKEQLKAIGADSGAIRRAMIAAYEAEMNVVIHACRGTLRAALLPERLDVEVADEGPGIPDIDRAMQEGFSTAPAAARALGFGAGMGLPNIRKHSDAFTIESGVGRGTRVRFTIYLKAQEAAAAGRRSVRVTAEPCRECLRCLRACPTRALRVRGGRPEILDYLCVDCAACLAACPSGALGAAGAAEAVPPADDAVLVVPGAMLFQFGPGVGPERVLAALAEMGLGDVRRTDPWESALRAAVMEHARRRPLEVPTISPLCPAVVNLLELRFPSLLGHVAPYLSPMEAAREDLRGRRAVFVAACPCQRTALEVASAKPEILTPAALVAALMPRIAAAKQGRAAPDRAEVPLFASEPDPPGLLRVAGMSHVLAVLEAAENGLLSDVAVLELQACGEGCFGAPALREDPFVARHRWGEAAPEPIAEARAVRRTAPLAPRAGLRLDEDMARAIEKLARIDEILRTLPGYDCGRCGAPTCAALAEDVVLGRAAGAACVRRRGG